MALLPIESILEVFSYLPHTVLASLNLINYFYYLIYNKKYPKVKYDKDIVWITHIQILGQVELSLQYDNILCNKLESYLVASLTELHHLFTHNKKLFKYQQETEDCIKPLYNLLLKQSNKPNALAIYTFIDDDNIQSDYYKLKICNSALNIIYVLDSSNTTYGDIYNQLYEILTNIPHSDCSIILYRSQISITYNDCGGIYFMLYEDTYIIDKARAIMSDRLETYFIKLINRIHMKKNG